MNFVKAKRMLTKSEKTARREKTISFIVLSIASVFFLFRQIILKPVLNEWRCRK